MRPTTTAPCTEREIELLVAAFYAKVRHDPLLGPIFEQRVLDWDRHLAKLMDFWSAILLKSGRYFGTPMPRHNALVGLTDAHFERWLSLFRETTAAQPNASLRHQAEAAAQRIARSLWYGYQQSHGRGALREFPDGAADARPSTAMTAHTQDAS